MFRYTLNSDLLGELVLNDAPIGWESKKLILYRTEYEGIFLQTTAELTFIRESYEYLKQLDNEYGYSAECSILIERFNGQTRGWGTELSGIIDFSEKTESTKDGKSISFKIISDDFSDKILSRAEVEIPYDRMTTIDDEVITPFTNEYQTIEVIGTELLSTNEAGILPEPSAGSTNFPGFNNKSVLDGWVSTVYKTASGATGGTYAAPDDDWVNDRAFFVPKNYSGTIKGKLVFNWQSTQSVMIWILLDYKTLTPIQTLLDTGMYTRPDLTGTNEITFEYDFDSDSRLALYWGSAGSVAQIYESTCEFKLKSIGDATDIKFVPPHEAITRIINGITGLDNAVYSEYFGRVELGYADNGGGSLLFLTNGLLMRGYPSGYIYESGGDDFEVSKVAQLSFKFKDFFNNLNSIYNIGAGVYYDDGYKLRIENKEYFYQQEVILTIDKNVMVSDTLERTRNSEFYFSEINIGYEFEQPEEVSGLEDYNTKETFSTPVKSENKLELISTYIGSAIVNELTRRKSYTLDNTIDYKYDKNILLLKIYDDGGYVQAQAQEYDEINGIDETTRYMNLDITPSRSLIKRWGWWINSGLQKYVGKKIKYSISDINTDLSTRKITDTELIYENADININNLPEALFSGDIITFSAPISANTFNLLKNDPYKLIKVWSELDDKYIYGWIKEVSTEPVDSSTNWTLYQANIIQVGVSFRIIDGGGYRLLDDGGYRLITE